MLIQVIHSFIIVYKFKVFEFSKILSLKVKFEFTQESVTKSYVYNLFSLLHGWKENNIAIRIYPHNPG